MPRTTRLSARRSFVEEVPGEFMSDVAKEFAHRLVVTSRAELVRSMR